MTESGSRTAPSGLEIVVGSLLLCLGIGAGLFARFHALGDRPLAVDEYYTLTSVGAIVREGLPALPGGGYYTRGLFPQYATTASVLLFGEGGFAYRLPAVLFGLASPIVLYFYALPTLGRTLAATVAVLLLVSSWEIEFARFARMYSGFQCVTLLFLLSADRAFFGSRWNLRYLPHAFGVVAVLSHSLGIFLLPLLFVPLAVSPERFPTRGHAVRYALVSAATIALCYAFMEFDFRHLGVIDPLPADFSAGSRGPLRLPAFPFWSVGGDPFASLVAMCGALALVGGALALGRAARRGVETRDVLAGVLVVSAALHAFVVAGVCALLLLARFDLRRPGPGRRRARVALGVATTFGAAWILRALLSRDWLAGVGGEDGTLLGGLRRVFFGWPDFYTPLVVPWSRELPLLGLLVAGACAFQLIFRLREPLPGLARNPTWVVLYVCLVFGVFASQYQSTRYAFFVYPVALAAIALTLGDLARLALDRWQAPAWARPDALAALLWLALFAASADFGPRHIAGVGTEAVGLRMGPFQRFEATWYGRSDARSPAEFLNGRAISGPGERIIVIGLPVVSHYLRDAHAVYYDRSDPRFRNVSRERGTRDLWSNQRLLSTREELRAYTAGASRVWLVRGSATARRWLHVEDVWGDRLGDRTRAFEGVDERIEIVSLSLDPA